MHLSQILVRLFVLLHLMAFYFLQMPCKYLKKSYCINHLPDLEKLRIPRNN